jgi:hypothetical protein
MILSVLVQFMRAVIGILSVIEGGADRDMLERCSAARAGMSALMRLASNIRMTTNRFNALFLDRFNISTLRLC